MIGSDHWLSSENAKTFPFLPAFYRKKIVFYFYLVSAGLNSQLYWKGSFFFFKDLWATTNLLAKPGRGGRGEGGAGAPRELLGTLTQGKVPLCESDLKPTRVPSALLHEPILFCLMAHYGTFCLVQLGCLWTRPTIFYIILSENSWKEQKHSIIPLWRMYLLGCCHLPPGQFCL